MNNHTTTKEYKMEELLVVPRAISEKDAATYLGISRFSLRQGRCNGRRDNSMPPPPYVRVGRRILYIISDLDRWLATYRISP